MATTFPLGLAFLLQMAIEPGAARVPISRVDTTEPTVALTFDACATRTQSNGFDRAIFDLLRAENVPATIFVSGRWVEAHPDVMGELAAESLIEFGDHSYDHPHMRRLTPTRIGEQIDQTEAALGRYGKKSVAFRPPFGEWNLRVLGVVKERKLPAVLWDVVSGDPSAAVSAQEMIRTVLRKTKAGSIVIFHINGRAHKTAEALPVILRELRSRGLRFVRLSELLAGPAPVVVPPSLTPPPMVSPPPPSLAPPPVLAAPLPPPAPAPLPPPAPAPLPPAGQVQAQVLPAVSRAMPPPLSRVGPDDPLPLADDATDLLDD